MQEIDRIAYEKFKIRALRPFQKLVIASVLRDAGPLLAILPTSAGKSICFQLPWYFTDGMIIAVYPLNSLIRDQKRRLDEVGIPSIMLIGGQTRDVRDSIWRSLSTGRRFILTNPETISQDRVLERLSRYKISLFVCDEAHVVSMWGRTFRPSYLDLHKVTTHLHIQKTLAFTATADMRVISDISRILFFSKVPHIIKGSCDRRNIIYHRVHTINKDMEIRTILHSPSSRPAIVFCRTRNETCMFSESFRASEGDIKCTYYHAGLTRDKKREREKWFSKTEDGVLFATCAFGLGMDVSHIRTVIHIDVHMDAAEYLQESGRAGRDGMISHAYVLIDPNDEGKLYDIFRDENTCIRKALMKMMDEEVYTCSGCDVCDGRKLSMKEDMADIIYNLIGRYPYFFTFHQIVGILKGQYERTAFCGVFRIRDSSDIMTCLMNMESCGIIERRFQRAHAVSGWK